ncbi:MAG: TonB-dependent receptor [Ideonella sp. MAG2]|nr:MAG: TonB-dependent receptor [Ideonella sp. MAG2]
MLSHSPRLRPTLLALAALLAMQDAAQAQTAETKDSSNESQSLETVVVRARGRDENQLTVPLSVKAFSAKAIEDAGIRKPGDFVAITPNLSLAETQSVGTSFMTIRGLSQVRNGEAPMAVVVDGVIQSDAKQFTQDLFDIQSIEVLRGPQGALYGRNASGGAILIRTKQPTNTTAGFAQLTLGTGHEKAVQGAVSGAIVDDKLFFRLAGSATDRDGYIDNRFLNRKADPYDNKTLRALLKWNVSDAMSVDMRANAVRDRAGGGNFQYQPTHLNADCTADLANVFDFSRLSADRVTPFVCANNFGKNTRDMDELTLKADYDFGFATLSGTFSHNKVVEFLAADQFPYTGSTNIFGGLFDGTQTQYVNVKSNSYELRLTSPSQKGLRWMGGIYGLHTDRFISSTVGSDLGKGILELSYDPAPAGSINPTNSWLADNNHNKASAVFGNIDYDITPSLEGSLALRYDRDERRQVVDYRQASTTLPAGCTAANPAACTKQATYSAMQPKVSLRYKIDSSSLVYASLGKGFRSGQFNQSGVAAAAAAATPAVNGVKDQVGAELTQSLELGYKTELLGGKLRLATAVFQTEVTNAPYFVFIGAVGAQVMVGIDKVRLTGGEIEASTSLAPGLDAYAGLGVTESTIKAYSVNPDAVGKRAPYVPNMSANMGMQYRFGLTPGLRMVLRGDVAQKGKQYWDPENSTARSAITLVNLRAGIEDAKGKWSTSLSVNNATNKIYNAEWVSGGFTQPSLPRIVRVDARYNF